MKWRCVRIEGIEDLRTTDPVWVFKRINSEAAVETAMVGAFDALFEKVVMCPPALPLALVLGYTHRQMKASLEIPAVNASLPPGSDAFARDSGRDDI